MKWSKFLSLRRFKRRVNFSQTLALLFVLAAWVQYLHFSFAQGVVADSLPSPLHRPELAPSTKQPVLLGFYTLGFTGDSAVIDQELRSVDLWVGQQASLNGFFIDVADDNPIYNITGRLETLWQKGYTAFINLKSQKTALAIAKGEADLEIREIARAYAQWVAQGDRVAYVAPLSEMNIAGEPYSLDAEHFKQAYQRIYQIFAAAGIRPQAIRWVFAPNGWSKADHAFEGYYPGNDIVDAVAFSGYNWGYCPKSDWKHWNTPQEVFEPYLRRLQHMAPQKPIFVAQTATTSVAAKGSSSTQKSQWLQEAYQYLATAPRVRGILYFNIRKECDWELSNAEGYRSAVLSSPVFQYQSPASIFHQAE